ncbi:hypothetical protein B0H17DRAFT_1183045 [Mycena rosella]|uniref:Uncharacterized protein n=1 Tax=Mycena rosella TaxID=1033263 RepID=A0AAD7D258_MYCRO|nr:hypothetical protein B0H17DRAFT_1183045 [Mycena rosella]
MRGELTTSMATREVVGGSKLKWGIPRTKHYISIVYVLRGLRSAARQQRVKTWLCLIKHYHRPKHINTPANCSLFKFNAHHVPHLPPPRLHSRRLCLRLPGFTSLPELHLHPFLVLLRPPQYRTLFRPSCAWQRHLVKTLPLLALDDSPMINMSTLRPGVSSPFAIDVSDIDIHILEILVPAVRAIARVIQTDPAGVGNTIVLEGGKAILVLGGLKIQGGLGMGEEVDKLDKMLTSTILRLAVELVLGTLAVLFARLCRRPVKMRISREMDVWVAGQLHCAVLMLLHHLRPAMFQVVCDGILAAAALSTIPFLSTMLATASWFMRRFHTSTPLKSADGSYAPPPPPLGRRKKRRWY